MVQSGAMVDHPTLAFVSGVKTDSPTREIADCSRKKTLLLPLPVSWAHEGGKEQTLFDLCTPWRLYERGLTCNV